MRRRLSISRIMGMIALLGLSLALLKSWVGPKNAFGFLGLFGWMVLGLGIAWYSTTNSARRFFAGAGITGFLLLLAVFLAPLTIVGGLWNWVFFPVIRRSVSVSDLNYYQFHWYWVESNLKLSSHFDQGWSGWLEIRSSIGTGLPDFQAILLIPFATLAIVGGLIATFARRKVIISES